jgi:hypothetical protein
MAVRLIGARGRRFSIPDLRAIGCDPRPMESVDAIERRQAAAGSGAGTPRMACMAWSAQFPAAVSPPRWR